MRPSECPKECEHEKDCLKFVSCGPDNMCENPCWKCLFWDNYGDVLRVKLNSEVMKIRIGEESEDADS